MAGQNSLALAVPSAGRAEASPQGVVVPSFSEVYQRYFDFVWSSARHLGVGSAALDDVVQEVFIVIHAKLHTLQRPEALRSWIYGVVRRTASGHRRSSRSEESGRSHYEHLVPGPSSACSTPLDALERNAQLELLSTLLAELDEAKREVFILADFQEMAVPEIADALEIPLNTAYSRLRAARQAFEAGLARRAVRLKEKGLR